MITIKGTGEFKSAKKYLNQLKEAMHISILDKYGKMGVKALESATPKDTGKTSESWYYKIERPNSGTVKLTFANSNVNKGVPIALILQLGHGTRNKGWVEGRDYINPAIQPIFDKIINDAWKEIKNL